MAGCRLQVHHRQLFEPIELDAYFEWLGAAVKCTDFNDYPNEKTENEASMWPS